MSAETDTPVVPDLDPVTLTKGSHKTREDGMCAMEAAAWLAGEPHSDHPSCVSPVLVSFVINWNDGLPSDEDRDRLIKPLLPLILNTADDGQDEARSWMAADWLMRVFTPRFLDLVPSLKDHAAALRDSDFVGGLAAFEAIRPKLTAARVAAGEAARVAAGVAAREAARVAAGVAAGEAAWEAARVAAWEAAWEAARVAARVAAWEAARVAARVALKPTVTDLQASAADLLRRMCNPGSK